jgi:putative FmdB family regulatory protein
VPLFEYECIKCGNRFEKIQKFSDRSVKTCPKCKGKVQRLPSAPAIQFKGTGWYITDYARKKEGPSEDKKEGSSEGKSSKSSDDKGAKSEDKSSKDKKSKPSPKKGSGE